MNPTAKRVGFVGVGQMGRPMVDRLIQAGVPVTAFVRRDALGQDLIAAGVDVSGSVAEVARAADVLCICTFSDQQVRDALALDAPGGTVLAEMRPGSIVVNHVTGSPELGQELARLAPAGVAVLDAPVSGTADQIRAGSLTVLIGGDGEALEVARPILQTYADPIIHVGPTIGDGQRAKLVNNLLFVGNLRLAMDAARLAESMDVDHADLARVLAHCSGASFALGLLERLSPELIAKTARPYLVKDVAVIRDVAASLGAHLGLLGEIASWVEDDGAPVPEPDGH